MPITAKKKKKRKKRKKERREKECRLGVFQNVNDLHVHS
jgi:hypothetical protein